MSRVRFVDHRGKRIILLVVNAFKKMTAANRPSVKAAAVVSSSS
jgi:hypothetical protein